MVVLAQNSSGAVSQPSDALVRIFQEVYMFDLVVNGQKRSVDVTPETPLLWVIREQLKLTGTKFGCGQGLCGACAVTIDGKVASIPARFR